MARIAGIDLPRRKRMEIALTSVYGIGRARAKLILDEAKFPMIAIAMISPKLRRVRFAKSSKPTTRSKVICVASFA